MTQAQLSEEREVLGIDDIIRMLPHRHPFLFLDRVVALEPGKRGVAVKNISITEPCFAGHFPGRALYPGVLLVECLAQLTAVVYGSGALQEKTGWKVGDPIQPGVADRVGYLAAIRNVKLLRPVRPGDQVRLTAQVGARFQQLLDVSVTAHVAGDLVLTGNLTVSELVENEL